MKNLYTENYTKLMEEIEDGTKKMAKLSMLLIGRTNIVKYLTNIVKMSKLPRAI